MTRNKLLTIFALTTSLVTGCGSRKNVDRKINEYYAYDEDKKTARLVELFTNDSTGTIFSMPHPQIKEVVDENLLRQSLEKDTSFVYFTKGKSRRIMQVGQVFLPITKEEITEKNFRKAGDTVIIEEVRTANLVRE